MRAMTMPLRIMGRAPIPASGHAVRDLGPADIALLGVARGAVAPTVKRIRDSHHALARALAGGQTPGQASITTGYSLSRISILLADTAFRELLAFYRKNQDAAFADVQSRMSALALDVVQEIQDRIDERPGEFTNEQLRKTLETVADRTGHGPVTRSINANIRVDLAARLETARQRAGMAVREEDAA